MTRDSGLIDPCGGRLLDLRPAGAELDRARAAAARAPRLTLSAAAVGDFELLATGALSPLAGFMGQRDLARVLAEHRLADGTPWPVPIVLEVPGEFRVPAGGDVALADAEGVLLGLIERAEVYAGPGGRPCLGGSLTALRLPVHHDFRGLRRAPAELRSALQQRGWSSAIAMFAAEPFDCVEEEAVRRALGAADGVVILRRARSATAGDRDQFVRIRCLLAGARPLDPSRVLVQLVPAGTELGADLTELDAILARNLGCRALLVGTGRAGTAACGLELRERPRVANPWGGDRSAAFQALRDHGTPLPEGIVRPDVAALYAELYPPRRRQGLTIWLTGLSQSGKSTISGILAAFLLERGRASTVLDGDVVRLNLSKGLGFSREDRDVNVRRIAFVAAEITRHGGTCIVAAISPYRAVRAECRARIGNYLEVYVNAPLAVCEARDQKGQYQKARAGAIQGFTGVDDPYEPPDADFVECRTDRERPEESAAKILARVEDLGYIGPP